MTNQRVLIICSVSYSLLNFRKDFIQELIDKGFEVWCAGPDFQDEFVTELTAMGAQTVSFNLQRKGLNPIQDFKTVGELKRIMKDLKIDFVFAYTIKPVIYGSFAARQAKLPMFSLITGLGYTFSGVSLRSKLLGQISRLLYRRALRKNNVAIFQNKDDKQLFQDLGILPKHKEAFVVNGSGINIDRFRFKKPEEFNNGGTVNFIMVGRMMVEKGIELYLDAALYAQRKNANAKFHIVGGPPANMKAMEQRLQALHKDGVIVYHGTNYDVRPFLTAADIFVLPTFYREGVPRSILEALSVGMPIITTDTPGCKETVVEGKNGFLVPPKQLDPILKAVDFFLENPERIEAMGKESRRLAEQKFDVRLINADLLEIINQHTS